MYAHVCGADVCSNLQLIIATFYIMHGIIVPYYRLVLMLCIRIKVTYLVLLLHHLTLQVKR